MTGVPGGSTRHHVVGRQPGVSLPVDLIFLMGVHVVNCLASWALLVLFVFFFQN